MHVMQVTYPDMSFLTYFLTLSLISYIAHISSSIKWPLLRLSAQLSLSCYIQWRLSAQLSLHYPTHSSPFTSINTHVHIYIYILLFITIYKRKVNQKYTKSLFSKSSHFNHYAYELNHFNSTSIFTTTHI